MLTLGVLIVAVVAIGGALLFARGGSGDSGTASAEVLHRPDSHALTTAADGKVTVVEFLDYQCSACREYYRALTKRIESDYAGRVTFVVRNNPLDDHPLAQPAARAAEAAAMQGRFAEYHHALYDHYGAWAVGGDGRSSADTAKATRLFEQYAQALGLDLGKFRSDVASPQVQARIDGDAADAGAADVQSTPTLFINGTRFEPDEARTFAEVNDAFRARVEEELSR
ncbi:DsbA family protein [Saccharopolyspora flava]|nr:thioredoxin domain-containing protein [Saccharopolyspora flava]